MNKIFAKYAFLFFLSAMVSVQLFAFGAVRREEMIFALLIFYGFGLVCLRLVGFVDWLAEKKEKEKVDRLERGNR